MSKCLKKFEYTRIYCEVDHNELDMMGEAGWELVAIELSKSGILPIQPPGNELYSITVSLSWGGSETDTD